MVKTTSTKAFSILSSKKDKDKDGLFYDLKQLRAAINELSKLKGIGPATASLILATKDHTVPFMADEALAAVGLPMRYDVSTYIKFADVLQTKCLQLNKIIDANSKENTNNSNKNTNKNKHKNENKMASKSNMKAKNRTNNKNDDKQKKNENSSDSTPLSQAENTKNSDGDTDEKKVEINDSEQDNSGDIEQFTPFMLSQCLWSYTMSEKFAAKATKTKKTKSTKSTKSNKSSLAGKKRKDSKAANKKSNKGVDSVTNEMEHFADVPPKKKRRVMKKVDQN